MSKQSLYYFDSSDDENEDKLTNAKYSPKNILSTLAKCVIHIKKDENDKKVRIIPFYSDFKQSLSRYIKEIKSKDKKEYLFESNWGKPFSPQGIRSILSNYSKLAQIKKNITPSRLRHFLFLRMDLRLVILKNTKIDVCL